MYQSNAEADTLHYTLPNGQEREVILNAPFAEVVLLVPEHNLDWAAALLAMWREQDAASHKQFRQAPHRHYVSHFLWGDEVPSAREEDRVFTQRRRLLAHYQGPTTVASVHALGVEWSAPLEAAPRVVSSKPGAARDHGRRRHRGVDVEAMPGEPVLAMADGTVSFAGVDLPGRGRNRNLPPERIDSVRRSRLGKGGRYVCISHVDASADIPSLSSCYMHLEDVLVAKGQMVSRGEVIGTVGRTGIKHSAPHLHLELRSDVRLYDARRVLPKLLIGEPPADRPRRKRRIPPTYVSAP
jgi:murein DD-endopeptidase MepM/ murein hydrolase activator NlpD